MPWMEGIDQSLHCYRWFKSLHYRKRGFDNWKDKFLRLNFGERVQSTICFVVGAYLPLCYEKCDKIAVVEGDQEQ